MCKINCDKFSCKDTLLTYNDCYAFEWDEEKNNLNMSKHCIDFVDAALIFLDCDRIEAVDDRHKYGEVRYRTIGIVYGIILCVVYTIRKVKYRIISARRANRNERETYLYNKDIAGG